MSLGLSLYRDLIKGFVSKINSVDQVHSLNTGGMTTLGIAGADTDIVVATAKAYLAALNKLHSKVERINPQL